MLFQLQLCDPLTKRKENASRQSKRQDDSGIGSMAVLLLGGRSNPSDNKPPMFRSPVGVDTTGDVHQRNAWNSPACSVVRRVWHCGCYNIESPLIDFFQVVWDHYSLAIVWSEFTCLQLALGSSIMRSCSFIGEPIRSFSLPIDHVENRYSQSIFSDSMWSFSSTELRHR